jgi:WD40-like Beta Propeller Repeat
MTVLLFSRSRRRLGQLAALVLAIVALSACSIDVSGVTPAATGVTQSTTAPSTVPLIAPTWTLGPTPTLNQATNAPNATGANGTPPPAATPGSVPGHPQPTPFSKPVTWADRHLSGKLVFTAGTEGVLQFDLATGNVTSVFAPPDAINSWVVAAAVSANPPQQVIAYAPPPVGGDIQFGYTTLFSLPSNGVPQPLFKDVQAKESFFDPTWSPDGKWLYYVHLTTPVTQTDTSRFDIVRLAYPDGQPAVVVRDAFWPRVSPDGQHLAFVHYDYLTGMQTLFVGNTDGTQPHQIQLPAGFQSTDSPMFTPDNKNLIFSGITDGSVSPALSWLDRLMGVRTAYADGSPADWWQVPVGGGPPKRLTQINDSSMYGNFSPDGQHIVYISASGLFVMKPNGTDIIQLLSITELPGSVGSATVDWLP